MHLLESLSGLLNVLLLCNYKDYFQEDMLFLVQFSALYTIRNKQSSVYRLQACSAGRESKITVTEEERK